MTHSSAESRCVDSEGKWYEATDITGGALQFRLVVEDEVTRNVEPVDAVVFLDALLQQVRTAEGEEAVLIAAHQLYKDLTVQVIPLDHDSDEETKEVSDAEQDDVLDDIWTAMSLMLTLQRWDVVKACLVFHRDHALTVLSHLVHSHEAGAEMESLCYFAPCNSMLAVPVMRLLPPSCLSQGEVELECGMLSVEAVLLGLKPLVDYVMCKQGAHDGASFLSRIPEPLRAAVRAVVVTSDQPSIATDLLIGVRGFFESCRLSSQHHLSELLQEFFHGALFPGSFPTTTSDKMNSSAALWLPYAPQDVQKLFMLAFWMNLRAQHQLPTQNVLQPAKQEDFERHPEVAVHPAELQLIAALLSPQYALEHFKELLHVMKACFACGSSIDRQPCSVTMLLTGSVIFAEAVHFRWPMSGTLTSGDFSFQQFQHKIEAMLSMEEPRQQLRQYMLSVPKTQTECFRELWVGPTAFHPHHKFPSRIEQLFFGVLDSVLVAAEDTEAREGEKGPGSRTMRETGPQWEPLIWWARRWMEFFATLQQSSRTPCSDASAPSTLHKDPVAAHMASLMQGNDTGSENELVEDLKSDEIETAEAVQKALNAVQDSLPDRLLEGKHPLPVLHAALFPSCNSAPTQTVPLTLEEQFEKAQKAFGKRAEREDDAAKLKFYGLFKQATVGDINIAKPWMMDRVGRAKWEAWDQCKGLSSEDAMKKYVEAYRALS